MPEYRGHRLGSAAQCLLADQLFSTTLANRMDATTAVDNIAEQKALESAGSQKKGILRGLGYSRGKMGDGAIYSRLRSDPHPWRPSAQTGVPYRDSKRGPAAY